MSVPPLFRDLTTGKLMNARVVKEDGKAYDLETVITKLSDAVKDEPTNLVSKDIGKLSLAAWTLLEVLTKGYFETRAESITKSISALEEAAFYTAIGIEIGLAMPKNVIIKTVEADQDGKEDPTDIWEESGKQPN